uniref:Uncharacterized protein n=1 Tax=Anguilla anguilla TaxID=7936 RepID=A0A0E9SQD8_ANGAN
MFCSLQETVQINTLKDEAFHKITVFYLSALVFQNSEL